MPHWKSGESVRETRQGTYRTRNAQDIHASLERKVANALTDSPIDTAAAALPNFFSGNQARLRAGARLEDLTLSERIDRHIPLIDFNRLPFLAASIGGAALAWHVATYGGDPQSAYHAIHAATDSYTPQWLSDSLNAINKMLWVFKGDAYPNAAVIGGLSTAAFAYGLAMGLIPWRGDQIAWKKSHRSEEQKLVSEGLLPLNYAGHIVGYGLRDPLASAEMSDGKSFTRHLRNEFGQVVLLQRKDNENGTDTYWRPKNLGLEMNDGRHFVSLTKIFEEGTPLPETLSPAILSGAYQAGGLLLNGQREFELFEDSFVDTPSDQGRLNFAFGAYLLRSASRLRDFVFEDAPRLRASIIVPQYLSPKEGFRKGGDSWRYTVQANFMTPGMPSLDGVIVPELVFLDMVFETLRETDALSKPIYIDTEGERDSAGKSQRCKDELTKLYNQRGISVPEIYTSFDDAKRAKVSILLRSKNRNTRQSVNVNAFEHGHKRVLYAMTQREDAVAHMRDLRERRRIAIPYKSEIARLAFEHLTGIQNAWSVDSLIERGQLRHYR